MPLGFDFFSTRGLGNFYVEPVSRYFSADRLCVREGIIFDRGVYLTSVENSRVHDLLRKK